jgi:hypothetical protein
VVKAFIQMSFSPQNLAPDQYQKCARVISIVLHNFDFPLKYMFYGAEAIMKVIENLPGISTSFFRCNLDDLKLALANWTIRKSIVRYFGRRIEFVRSSLLEDIISEGEFAFVKGYQVKF